MGCRKLQSISGVSHLKECISTPSFQPDTRFSNLKRCRQRLSRNTGTQRTTRGGSLLLGAPRRWIGFIQQSKRWLCTERDGMCPDMCCVFVFHDSSLQTHPELPAKPPPRPRCSSPVRPPLVRSAQEPQPVIYYLPVFCLTRVRTAGHTVALSQAASPYL